MTTRRKWVILLSVLIALGALGTIFFFSISDRHYAATIQEAQQAYQMQQYDRATELLQKILHDNPADEMAYVLLAQIAEHQHNFRLAAYCWQQAANLNPLNEEYPSHQAANQFALADHLALRQLLKAKFDSGKLSPEQAGYYLEAAAETMPRREFDVLRQKQKEPLPRWQEQELAAIMSLRSGRFPEAEKQLSAISFASLSPQQQFRFLSLRAVAAYAAGNHEAAERFLQQAEQLSPFTGSGMLADFYLKTGRNAEAKAQLRKALEYPGNDSLRPLLAERFAAESDLDGLRALLQNHTPANRDDLEAFNYQEAMLAYLEGNERTVLTKLASAPRYSVRPLYRAMQFYAHLKSGDYEKLPGDLKALNELNPSPQARQELVYRLHQLLIEQLRAGKYDAAEQTAVLLAEEAPAGSASQQAADLTLLQAANTRGDTAAMLLHAGRILAREPNNHTAAMAMAQALLATGKARESLLYLQKLPKDTATCFQLARAYQQLGERPQTQEAYQKAWEQAPGNIPLFLAYAEFLLTEKAYGRIEQLISQLPESEPARYAANCLRGQIAQANNQPETARKYLLAARDALKAFPDSPENRYQYAYLSALADDNQAAAKAYRNLLVNHPDQLLILVNLSEVEAALGNHAEALQLARQAIKLAPTSPMAGECLRRREAAEKKLNP